MKQVELIDKRKPREKHFLQEDGTIVAKIYDKNIHFLKNGKYEEIDNSLIKENDNYINKNNSFKVSFKENCKNELMKMESQGHYLNIKLKENKETFIKKMLKNSKFVENIKYENILNNVDLEYKVLPSKVKESIIFKEKDSVVDKLSFFIETDLILKLNEDNSISAVKQMDIVFRIEPPYMYDSIGNRNNNIIYNLKENNGNYELELLLDTTWLNSPMTIYPVIVDPTITNDENTISVWDTYIYPGDTYDSRYTQDILKVGVERIDGVDTINRALIQFDLPTIGTGSQIIDAQLNLTGYLAPANTYDSDLVEIHRITENWSESGANWSNMYNKFDTKVETCFYSQRSYLYVDNTIEPRTCNADITNLVKRWYTDLPNYGIMLKQTNEQYNTEYYPAFFSRDNDISGENPKPVLYITYRNQNGYESYMKYIPQLFSIGATYVNTYNGNIFSIFDLGSTIKGKFPVNLSLIYNTNDVVLNNNLGYGLGFRLNLHQSIKKNEEYDSLEYIDEDGTIHYYYKEKTTSNEDGSINTETQINTYYDEDGLETKIVEEDNKYILIDNSNNKMEFTKGTTIALLTKIIDMSLNEVTISYTNDKITKIIDSNNEEITITYAFNKITIVSPQHTTILNYDNGNILTSIVTPLGSLLFECNNHNIISQITNMDGKKISYNYYNEIPYRLKKIQEYGLNNLEGSSLEFFYNLFSTTIIDNNQRTTTMTFNKYGNVVSTTNLKSNSFVSDGYGLVDYYGTNHQHKNKIISNGSPIGHVNNLLSNTSFEDDIIIFDAENGVTQNISTDCYKSGKRSLKIVNSLENKKINKSINVTKGKYYTFSCYLKNTNNLKLELSYINSDNEEIKSESSMILSNDDFERYDVSIYYPEDSISLLNINITLNTIGIVYIDDVQLEKGEVANFYNYFENSDFSNGYTGWECDASQIINNEHVPVNPEEVFEIVTLEDGSKALKIKMDLKYGTGISKSFNQSGVLGDNYTISFWYKNEGILSSTDETYNSVVIGFEYEYGQGVIPTLNLNPSDSDWQFFSYTFYAEHDYKSMYFSFFQALNANNLYITNLSLFKNIKETYYTYDINGNITGISNSTEKQVEYSYDSDNQITKVTDISGQSSTFEYDNLNKNKILRGTTNSGIMNLVVYDNNGKEKSTKIKNKGTLNSKIGKNYTLRFKGTTQYFKIISGNIILVDNPQIQDKWLLESEIINEETYYKIRHSIIDKYMTIQGDNIILSDDDSDSSKFLMIKNEDGSYKLKSKINERYIKNNNSSITVEELDENDEKYNIFIDCCDNKIFIEENTVYSSDGKYINITEDSLLNKTNYDIDLTTGLTKKTINPKNHKIQYYYDEKKRLTKVEQTNINASYEYNSQNLLSKISHGTKEYNILYDDFLNLKSININNKVMLVTNDYKEKNGPLIKQTYGNGNVIQLEYDEFDRIKTIIKEDNLYKYNYDMSGNLGKISSNEGDVKYYYDQSKRLKEMSSDNFRTKYHYDNKGYINNKSYKLDSTNNNIVYQYNEDDGLSQTIINDNHTINYEYDKLGNLCNKNINNGINTEYHYKKNGNRSSTLINNMIINNDSYNYKYDKLGNITHIYINDELMNKYYYNEYNELIREDNYKTNKTIRYKYDLSGNILSKKEFKINTYDLTDITRFKYNNNDWEDQLTNINGEDITYDSIGNPIKIGTHTQLVWTNGRELKKYINTNQIIDYKYNEGGYRTKKIINNVVTDYYLENGNVIYEQTGNNKLFFMRNSIDDLIGFKYNDNIYFYKKNLQDDIIGIYDSNNSLIAKYDYDSWGNIETITDAYGNDVSNDMTNIANINPYRYRSYYYDKETNLYYLNDRYYNPKWCRFLNLDIGIANIGDFEGYNLYKYACNNPINCSDESGNIPKWLKKTIKIAAIVAVTAVVATAVIAAAPAVAGAAGTTALYYGGTVATAKAVSTVATVACATLAATTVAIGVNRTVETVTGKNYGAKIMGEDNYNNFEACVMTTAMIVTSIPQNTGYPSTGRTEPQNLQEKMTIEAAKQNPTLGTTVEMKNKLSDTRFPGWLGWQKYSQVSYGTKNVDVHYIGNKFFKFFFDFKIK